MNRFDLDLLTEAYKRILKEDLGTGPNTVSTLEPTSFDVVGSSVATPAPDNTSEEKTDTFRGELKTLIHVAEEIDKQIGEHTKEPWISSHITSALNNLKSVLARIHNPNP